MKVNEKIAQWRKENPGRPFFSLEFFPPKTISGKINLFDRFERFSGLNPLWIDVTWGACGSTSSATLDICCHALKYCGLEPLMHLTCTNATKESIHSALEECKKRGIRNILALRGDPPLAQQSWVATDDSFRYAIDLVKYIRKEYGDYFCIVVAGYPEGHLENPDREDDLRRLKEKIDAGADLIITQLFFDLNEYFSFLERARAIGITVPIIPGVMPVQSYAGFMRFVGICKTKIPKRIMHELGLVKDDDQKVKDFGVALCIEMCRQLLQRGAWGLHFYTLNLEVSVVRIIEGLDLVDSHLPNRELPFRPRRICVVEEAGSQHCNGSENSKNLTNVIANHGPSPVSKTSRATEEVRPIFWSNRPKSYIHRTDAWDDFPNGRWGNRHSPAFGEPFYSMCTDPEERSFKLRKSMWCADLQSEHDVIQVFTDFLRGDQKVKQLPWSTEDIGAETTVIRKQLVKLNGYGLCTINSQPRVNGALSTDPYFGWGPKGGFCYQKAYVEFFCKPEVAEALIDAFDNRESCRWFTYAAVNIDNDLRCNYDQSGGRQMVNAVTWGVFPNSEIRQPTVVDLDSFLAWKDEAFTLWKVEWGAIYPEGSLSHRLIERIHDTWYLMNIVDNNFVCGDLFGELISIASQVSHASTPSSLGPSLSSESIIFDSALANC